VVRSVVISKTVANNSMEYKVGHIHLNKAFKPFSFFKKKE
jgi:hypothetical protein